MNRSNSLLAAFIVLAVSGCGQLDQATQPHQSVTLLAGVQGHLATCKSVVAGDSLSSNDALEFAPLGRSFATDMDFPVGASPVVIEKLARSQSELSDCIEEVEARAGILSPAR